MSGHLPDKVQQFSGVVSGVDCIRWLRQIELVLDEAAAPVRPCSLRLSSLPDLFDDAQASVCRHPALQEAVHARLGARLALLADHCWVRHQPAPSQRQPGQTPHSWHQDGALAFDFMASTWPYPSDALLPMLTCWLTLTACGDDAPSLAWFEPPQPLLWTPEALRDDAVDQWSTGNPASTLHQAVLRPGDGLLFSGGTLHRTHATDPMTNHRISLELRWLPADAVPARLEGGQIVFID